MKRPDGEAQRPHRRLGCLSLSALMLSAALLVAAIAFRPQSLPLAEALPATSPARRAAQLRSVASFASIADSQARSIALFEEAGRVIQHPRCMNCHPRTDRPMQGDAMRQHMPAVTRGPDDLGAATLRCATCHHDANFGASNVPGNRKWKLAPAEQAWEGKSLGEICRQMLDPARSHMTREQLLRHMAHDELVGWGWHPGGDRTPVPGTQAEFGELIEAWLETGAACPA
jgi:hypothetical protein